MAGDLIEEGIPLKEKGKVLTRAGRFHGQWYPKPAVGAGQNPAAYQEFGLLAAHLRYAERACRKLARSTFYGMALWRGRTEEHGAFLGRIVDIGAELYGICCAVAYARTMAAEQPEHTKAIEELADLFCKQSQLRAERLFHDLWHNADSATYAVAQGVLDPSDGGPMVPDSGHASGTTPGTSTEAKAP